MGTWTSSATFEGDPQNLVALLTEVDEIATWSPVPFRISDGADALRTGEQVEVKGALLGRGIRFRVDVDQADDQGISLRAKGPFEIDVDYRIEAASSTVQARVETRGSGPLAKALAAAANAMLAAGALDCALGRIVARACPAPMTAAV
jgi:hypothetical protein